jgi:hypothetical protein
VTAVNMLARKHYDERLRARVAAAAAATAAAAAAGKQEPTSMARKHGSPPDTPRSPARKKDDQAGGQFHIVPSVAGAAADTAAGGDTDDDTGDVSRYLLPGQLRQDAHKQQQPRDTAEHNGVGAALCFLVLGLRLLCSVSSRLQFMQEESPPCCAAAVNQHLGGTAAAAAAQLPQEVSGSEHWAVTGTALAADLLPLVHQADINSSCLSATALFLGWQQERHMGIPLPPAFFL